MKRTNMKKIMSVVTALGICIAPMSTTAKAGECALKDMLTQMLADRQVPAISDIINMPQSDSEVVKKLGTYIKQCGKNDLVEYLSQFNGLDISCIISGCNKAPDHGADSDTGCDDCTPPDGEEAPSTEDNVPPAEEDSTENTTPPTGQGPVPQPPADIKPPVDDNTNNDIADNPAGGGSHDTSTDKEPSSDSSSDNVDVPYGDGYAMQVVSLVNKHRTAAGLAPLSYSNTSLMNAASKRATEQATLYSHTRPDGTSCFTVLDEYGISYRRAGENIAMGQTSAAEVVEDWMNSPGHRENIMNPDFTHIGVGVYSKGNRMYWAQMFVAQ